jgi:SAM-dependent methyltransferase
MTTTEQFSTAGRDLETARRAIWGLGDYPAIANDLVAPLGAELVAAAGIGAGIRVLDVAAGTGNAAIPAAATGARVVASDLVPALLAEGARHALALGVDITWQEANAEALPYTDGEFDTVMSCIGVMFAPHHQLAADELIRVVRPGGTIAVLSWTPGGFVGGMFAAMRPFVAPPPPGVSPPPLWGDPGHVAALFADRVTDLVMTPRFLTVDRFDDGAQFRDYFKATYGPVINAYRGIADRPEKVAALDAALAELGDTALDSAPAMGWEYLLVTARRAE